MNSSSLALQAPGLFRDLRTLLTPEELEDCERCYDEVISRGGTHEGAVRREPGVSFNPRPARIVAILLREYPELFSNRCREIVCAAFRSCLSGPLVDPDLTSSALLLAHALDEVRHLHMTDLTITERHSVLEHARNVSRSSEHLSELSRLILCVTTALQRYERREQ